ncbi:MAG: BON domain-containing protein [Rickettsiaceae bacterium]|nr:BON domain-containing protein [Rickettsiaceae bacterium]MDP4832333.1 BON domain-containing protein [Rickettsiaceae bacterium]MDP5021047.1 BON domain-containing protein [Rickettsiaceae bacterium]
MLQKKYITIVTVMFASVMLSGCLETMFAGTAGGVMEFAKDRPAGDTMTDVRISTSIKGEFIKKNFRDLYTKIKIEVVQGRVLFTGVIDNEQDSIVAVQIAWNQEGVNEVINELKVNKNSGKFNLVQYTRDAMITSQIKSKTFMNRDIKFVNYTVITLNDIVYLFGIARSEEELEKVAAIASNVHGVEKVVSHVRVQNSANKMRSQSKGSSDSNDLLIDKDETDLNLDQGLSGDW